MKRIMNQVAGVLHIPALTIGAKTYHPGRLLMLLLSLVFLYSMMLLVDWIGWGQLLAFKSVLYEHRVELLQYMAVGFVAQLIDGALGMAYGVSSTSFLLSLGLPPAAASASVHLAEVFTTGFSGLAHLTFRNVSRKLLGRLILPGMIGAAAGAYLLSSFDGDFMKPFISLYLLIMGGIIIRKALRKQSPAEQSTKNLGALAAFGGLVDAIGGGGWGPVVTTTLLGRGHHARYVIGSVNTAEFFVALTSSIFFLLMLGSQPWLIVMGLVLGGLFSAPLAAWLCQRLKPRTLMLIVGTVIILLSLRTVFTSWVL
ncbi:hypothetical protein SAMN05421823_102741 [Catalinimonas alkaloidigena]|uniref:Probable membrane transporter protein n=1 Tax=Catalinimonas alkaloidigena TaxID=1075417 RepID=A0A1G9BXJ8_9BACT|nr:sulfite exporter TauE/SafE family protein [Catalinimonas alkaloidigena]SDK44176.1 hypothetical protein SAMN05421823_102741 [Catalinimonas alkaloidigena]